MTYVIAPEAPIAIMSVTINIKINRQGDIAAVAKSADRDTEPKCAGCALPTHCWVSSGFDVVWSMASPTVRDDQFSWHGCTGRAGSFGVWCTPVEIFQADDVILAEIAAALDLNDTQRNLARILQSVNGAHRYVNGLVFV